MEEEIKISELDDALLPLGDTDKFIVVQGGTTKKVSKDGLIETTSVIDEANTADAVNGKAVNDFVDKEVSDKFTLFSQENSIYKSNKLYNYLFDSEKYSISLNNAPTPTENTIDTNGFYFSKIKQLNFNVGAVSSNYLVDKILPIDYNNFAVSFWFAKRVDDGVENNNSAIEVYLRYRAGFNDAVIKSIFVTFKPSTHASTITANGFYEDDQTDYTLRCNGVIEYDGQKFYNMTVFSKYTPTVDVDYIEFRFGEEYILAQNKDNEFKFTGFEYFDYLPKFTTKTVNDFYNGEIREFSVEKQTLRFVDSENNYRNTYELDNLCKDLWDGCGIFRDFQNGSTYQYSNGQLNFLSGITNSAIDSPKFNIGYKLENSGAELPKYVNSSIRNELFIFDSFEATSPYNFINGTFGFWINRAELNGNDLYFNKTVLRTIIRYKDLTIEGFKETYTTSPYEVVAEVVMVDGDYTYIKINNSGYFSLSIGGSNSITSLTIYNPTIIESEIIDPYYIYKSTSEKNNSKHRGKWLMNFGDSQQNDRAIVTKLSKELGLNIMTASLGGHRMKYSATHWMFKKDYRKLVLDIDYIDYYFMMVSSNDFEGGGDASESAVQSVIDNYYSYGDNASQEASKDALFNALTETERDNIFGFKQCYSAYLKELQTTYPNAKFLLSSIPISQYGSTEYDVDGITTIYKSTTDADAQRIIGDTKFPLIKADIIELTNKHNTNFIDLFRESGFTYENFPSKVEGADSVHWKYDVKVPFAYPVWAELDKMNIY